MFQEQVSGHVPAPRQASVTEVPVIDAGPLWRGDSLAPVADSMRLAGGGLGFFYVRNHGIPDAVLDAVFAASRSFFAAPEPVRAATLRTGAGRGYYPLGFIRQKGQAPSLIDSFDMGIDFQPDHEHVRLGLPGVGPNVWPDIDGFREPVQAYFDAVMRLGMALLRPLALSLQLPEAFFVDRYSVPRCSLRLLRYPRPESVEGDFGIGARPHTDHGLLTLLAQDPAGGLELLKPDGEWVAAPHIPGTLVVNLGDLAARWTNDAYRSSPHRVVNRLERDRFSIPFFFNPEHRTLVECLPSCVTAERPARYGPVVAGDYTHAKAQSNRVQLDASAAMA
jgi:isopenicillin N synthase-like dioxygenase